MTEVITEPIFRAESRLLPSLPRNAKFHLNNWVERFRSSQSSTLGQYRAGFRWLSGLRHVAKFKWKIKFNEWSHPRLSDFGQNREGFRCFDKMENFIWTNSPMIGVSTELKPRAGSGTLQMMPRHKVRLTKEAWLKSTPLQEENQAGSRCFYMMANFLRRTNQINDWNRHR